MIDSATIASETPAQASQTPNVRKCPVLSGPTDPAETMDVSTDTHKTCEQIPSCPDQTSTAPQPPAAPQQDQTPQHDLHQQDVPASLLPERFARIPDNQSQIPLPSIVPATAMAVTPPPPFA